MSYPTDTLRTARVDGAVAATGGAPPTPAAWRRFLRAAYGPRTWKELAFGLLGFPLGIAGFVFVVVTTSFSVGSAITFVGLPLLALCLTIERAAGHGYRTLGRTLLGSTVADPAPRPVRDGFFAKLGGALGDAVSWRSWAYLLLRFPLSIVSFVASFGFWVYALGFLTYPAWFWAARQTAPDGTVHHGAQFWTGRYLDTWPLVLLAVGVGIVLTLLAPWVLRGAMTLERWLMHGLLGPTRMSERVRELEATRAAAVDTSAASLRRIERDLHDGTQAQLVALAMQLGQVREDLEGAATPEELATARDRIDEAHTTAKAALGELRDVVRGIHPPALDVGLDNALATLAARSPVPVSLVFNAPVRPSPAIESIAYFAVAELLTNVNRHSGAAAASVTVAAEGGGRLRITVADDGRGGAEGATADAGGAASEAEAGGTGLAGLRERVATVDGWFAVSSPHGGPTVVTIGLPLHA